MQKYIKKILGSGHNATLIISNDEMEDILKIVKSLEDSGLLSEGVSETIKNEAKEQNCSNIRMLIKIYYICSIFILIVHILYNKLHNKVVRTGKGTIRVGYCMDLKEIHLKKVFDSTTSFNKL